MKTFTCPICNRQFKANSPYWHTRTCAKRPEDSELHQDRDNGMNYADLARKYNVSHDTVRKWCIELGIDGRVHASSGKKIKVYPDQAVLFGAGVRCEFGHGRNRQWCIHYGFCKKYQREWVKCEAPDSEQLDGWMLGNTERKRYGDVD